MEEKNEPVVEVPKVRKPDNVCVSFWLTPEEIAKLDSRVREACMTRAAFCRAVILKVI